MANPDGSNNGTFTTTGGTEATIASSAVAGTYWPWISMENIVDGDQFLFKLYSILLAGGASELVEQHLITDAPTDKIVPFLNGVPNQNTDANSVKVTVTRITANNRAFPYVFFKYT